MADTTQTQSTAAEPTPGHKPAGAGNTTPSATRGRGERATTTELDLDAELDAELGGGGSNEIDPELDADLPKPQSNKGNQAPGKTKPKAAPKADEESDEDALNSAVEKDGEEEEEAETVEVEEDEPNNGPTDEELEAAMPENSDDIDPDQPPKGLEAVPKPVWKRIKKQSEQLRELKGQLAEGAFVLQPTPDNPLADVAGIEELDERVAQARADRKWARENPEGGERKVNGKTVEVGAEDVAGLLAKAEAVIDADATTRTRLQYRAQSKPWAKATAVEPDLFVKGTPANAFLVSLVEDCPEITKHPEWEYFAAVAAKGMRQVVEERDGKARWVRFEVGEDGKLLPLKPKAKGGTVQAGGGKPKPKATPATPPSNPSSARPAITRKGPQKEEAAGRLAGSDADLAVMLADELR